VGAVTTYDNSDLLVAGGDVIYAADLNDITARMAKTYKKGGANSRFSTTLADDPELAGIPLAVGVYEIELVGYFTLATTNTQKLKTRWGFTGSWNGAVAARTIIGPGSAQTAAPANVTEVNLQAVHIGDQDAIYDTVAGTGSYSNFRELCGEAIVTVQGNLSLQWAQSVTSANATTLQEGSYFRVRKVA
jgi:hypothetical protein